MYSTLKDHQDHVYRVHADGFIVDKKMDLKISKQMGHWKLANAGTVVIHIPILLTGCNFFCFST